MDITRRPPCATAALLAVLGLAAAASALAATTINTTNRYAYAANLGWIDAYADGASGAVITDYACSGYLYAANVGWINLGSGSPTNGIRYQNLGATDFGVNNDGLGNLRGYAWGANIGWVNFENTGAPKADLVTGKFSGWVWSANCGWISLSNAQAYVKTDHILPGPLAPNGLPIPWLIANFGTTNVNASADPDGDHMTNGQEYEAGTNPNNGANYLRITSFSRAGTYNTLQWTTENTRLYRVERRATLDTSSSWAPYISLDWPGWSAVGFDDFGSQCYYRIKAVRPLP